MRARRQAKEKGLCLHTRDKGLKRRSAVPLCLPGCLSGPLCSRAKAARTRRDGRITTAGRHSLLRARTRGRFSLLLGGDVSGGPRRCLAPPGSSLARSFRRTLTSSTLYCDKLMMYSHIIRLPRKKSTPFMNFCRIFLKSPGQTRNPAPESRLWSGWQSSLSHTRETVRRSG